MRPDIYFSIIYQLYLVEKLIKLDNSIASKARYEGIREALMYVLSLEEDY